MMRIKMSENSIAVCFFGLVKNIDHTYHSIMKHIVDPLRHSGYHLDFYCHTYDMSTITNPRNDERNIRIHPRSIYEKFSFVASKIENPNDYTNLESDVNNALNYGEPWPENPRISLRNLFLCLRSLKLVTSLWKDKKDKYKYVIYLRPDIRFTNTLDLLSNVRHLHGQSLYTPNFQLYNGYNDRFAYGTPEAMIIYGERLDYVSTYFEKHKRALHAETYLSIYLHDMNVKVHLSSIRFQRIRADNRVACGD